MIIRSSKYNLIPNTSKTGVFISELRIEEILKLAKLFLDVLFLL